MFVSFVPPDDRDHRPVNELPDQRRFASTRLPKKNHLQQAEKFKKNSGFWLPKKEILVALPCETARVYSGFASGRVQPESS
jgi:hypothetical protein